jgi:hypothetical protein
MPAADICDMRSTLPIALERRGSGLVVAVLQADPFAFGDPFFLDTLAWRFGIDLATDDGVDLVRPLHLDPSDSRLGYVPLSAFIRDAEDKALGDRCNVIFHMARCGSTLLTQMLSASGRFMVLSEPPIVNQILDPRGVIDPNERTRVLKATLSLFAAATPPSRGTVIKLRSWNAFYADSVVAAVPAAPWLFVHRHGAEVLASVVRQPPGWLRSRHRYAAEVAGWLGIDAATLRQLGDDEYAARLIGAICGRASTIQSPLGRYLDYEDIAHSISAVARHFGQELTDGEQQRGLDRMAQDAKAPSKPFVPDSGLKRQALSPIQRALADTLIEPLRRVARGKNLSLQSPSEKFNHL